MNFSLLTADRVTHLKIVAVALVVVEQQALELRAARDQGEVVALVRRAPLTYH